MEHIRHTAHNVRHALQKVVIHRPLSMVLAPGLQMPRQEFHQKAELEKACLAEASQCFTQAQDTPFLTSPLLDIFGECGKLHAMHQVLEGTFQPLSGCDSFAARLLSSLDRPATIQDVSPHTIMDYTHGWQKAHEMTSC